MLRATRLVGLTLLMPTLALAGQLSCPDNPGDTRIREAMATSAPEVKASLGAQDDSSRWSAITKPLIQKAIKQAKEQRSAAMQDGIEHACNAPQIYVGQLLPVPDKPSGCEHRVVTRPADPEHAWVQVVATCKYAWSCCTPEAAAAGKEVGYTLEGPLGATAATTTPPAKPKSK